MIRAGGAAASAPAFAGLRRDKSLTPYGGKSVVYYFTECRPVFGRATVAGLRRLGFKIRRLKLKN